MRLSGKCSYRELPQRHSANKQRGRQVVTGTTGALARSERETLGCFFRNAPFAA